MELEKLKTCKKCHEAKPFSDFYRKPDLLDGVESTCKKCKAEYRKARMPMVREARRRHYEANREMMIKRVRESWTKEQKQRWRRNSVVNNPIKTRARGMVHDAIKSGKLIRQPCLVCGNNKAEAHHEDYSKPLDLMWMCRSHHRAWHRLFVINQASEDEK